VEFTCPESRLPGNREDRLKASVALQAWIGIRKGYGETEISGVSLRFR
jgi:hypothetical protein